MIGEYLGRPLLKRVRNARATGPAARRRLRTADDRHKQLVGADQRERRPRGHRSADGPVPQAVSHVGVSVAAMPRPGSHRASAGTAVLRCAESSITIELEWISPSTVSGTRRPVHPALPCARIWALLHRCA
jgi:hypothetical protein